MTGRVLLDDHVDKRLGRDGSATLDVCPGGELQELRARFLELQAGAGGGFHSDLTSTDLEYRREADRLIGDALDERLAPLFAGYEPFLHNFVCKFPGADNYLYLHQDWMYVDERTGERTFVVWIALEDIDGDNGQLKVLRSSHRFPRDLRGTQLTAPWLRHQEVIEERLSWVPLRAGSGVVFDNALVHSSAPNLTDEPRVAVAVGFRRTGAPLVHLRRRDEGTATLHRVDRDFFLVRTPQDLEATGIDAAPDEVLPVVQHDMDARTLARRIDSPPLARLDQARRIARRAGSRATDTRVAAAQAASKALASLGQGATKARGEAHTGREKVQAAVEMAPTAVALQVLRVNEAVIDRFGPDTPAVWNPHDFSWAPGVEAGWADIREEVDRLLEGPTEVPHIEDVTGGIPQGNVGPWRSFVLMHQGKWIDWNCARCPRTTALVRSIPGLTLAGFSVLEPGTHITEHRGPNKGALRYQLGVIVPGADGDCRIRVGDEMLVWREKEGVAFDFTVPHEAWNDSDGIRVLLMLEVLTPLPWYLDGPNRVAQRAMGWFPTTRDMKERLRKLEPSLVKQPVP